MRSFTTQSHTVWDCKYHVVIVPKYRKKILFGHTCQRIGRIIRKLTEERYIEMQKAMRCPITCISFCASHPERVLLTSLAVGLAMPASIIVSVRRKGHLASVNAL